MEVRLLGPVELYAGDRRIDLGPPRQRTVLAALALEAGRPVRAETLVERVWDGEPPADARPALYAYISRIRRVLQDADGPAATRQRLPRQPGGYLLQLDPDRVDLHRFRRLAAAAGESGRRDAERVDLLGQALASWRGTPLADLAGGWAARTRAAWQQRRLDVVVAWADAQLRLGRPEEVIDPVRDALADYPLAEPLAGALMRALVAVGRTAEAIDCYAATRARLADELGADPGAQLRELHQSILRGGSRPTPAAPAPRRPAPAPPGAAPSPTPSPAAGPTPSPAAGPTAGPTPSPAPSPTADPAPGPAPSPAAGPAPDPAMDTGRGWPVPAQLPSDVAGFTDRAAELATLDALLAGADPGGPRAVAIAAVYGTAGVGKTALAVHWAHRVADRFPDGQLYVNLRGFDPTGRVTEPATAVRGFLDALGVPARRLPPDLDAQIALYRSLLNGKRILVVLDNARDADQVRPLLPGTPTALAVVTSRNQLTSLVAADGAHPVCVDLLSAGSARQLLAARIGPDRVSAEPEAAGEIVTACARLPLALTVAAASAWQTGFPLAALAAELTDARYRLSRLDAGDPSTDVPAVFSWSYAVLTPPAARLFRLLGLHPGPHASAGAAASLAGLPPAQGRSLLAEVARASLITEPSPGRYACHDLLRAYAAGLAHGTDPADERRAATTRLLDHYTHTVNTAAGLLDQSRDPIPFALAPPAPGAIPAQLAGEREATGWLTDEHHALLAALRLAADAGLDSHVWQLARGLSTFLVRRGYWHDHVEAWQAALAAADRLGNPAAGAYAHRELGRADSRWARYAEAHSHLRRALELAGEAGDTVGQAHTHRALSYLQERQGHVEPAVYHDQQALTLYRAAGHRRGQANALNAVGWNHALLGDHDQALTYCQQALALFQQAGDRDGEAATWDSVGYAYHQLGRHTEAVDCYRRALTLFRDLGDRYYEAVILGHLGDTQHVAGAGDAARTAWEQALAILSDLDHPEADRVRGQLAELPVSDEFAHRVTTSAVSDDL